MRESKPHRMNAFRIRSMVVHAFLCISIYLSMKTYSRYNTRYSKDTLRLSEPEMNMKTMGDRAFREYGPVQWNKLQLSLRSLSNVEIKDSKTIKRQVETFKKDPKNSSIQTETIFRK